MSQQQHTQEPVAHQFQGRDGEWYEFINQDHYENTVADGTWPIRALYTFPPDAAARISELEKQRNEFLAALAWQPIETAPKDRAFLAVLECGGEQTICTMRWNVAVSKNNRPEGKHFHVERVTHWMRIPNPPEIASVKEQA